MSTLTDDLRQIPNIIGSLGLAIAEAQKHFDENYLRGLERLAVMAKSILGPDHPADTEDFLRKLIETAAPTRYQFTQTTVAVKLDLAESKNFAASGGLGFGFAGVVVNAAFSYGYSQDYRAGAEIHTVLNAVLPQNNTGAFKALISKDVQGALELPPRTALDEKVIAAMKDVAARVGAKPADIGTKKLLDAGNAPA